MTVVHDPAEEIPLRTRSSGIVSGVLALVLAGAIGNPAHAGGSGEGTVERDGVVADAATTLAHGRVLDREGAPVPGATIEVSAFPGPSVMGSLAVGDTFILIPVVITTSASDGTFTIPADYRAVVGQVGPRPASPVNVQILVNSPSGSSAYSVAIDLSSGVAKAVVTAPDTAATANSRVERGLLAIDLRLTESPLGSLPGSARELTSGTASEPITTSTPTAASIPSNCTLVTDYGPRWVIVGQTSATTGGHTQRFTYTTGASSSLGVGYSLTGAYGSFSSSGTQSWSSESTIGFPVYSTSGTRLMETQYRYAKVRCRAYMTGAYYYNVIPTGYVSGSVQVAATAPTANYCTSFSAGSTFSKSSSIAVTYSNGVKIASAIGVDLSARTGFTSVAKLDYTFTSARHLCGKSDYPGGTPHQLVVKP